MESRYVEWLKQQGNSLFEGGGLSWRLYNGALVPAPVSPCFAKLSIFESRALLKASGAWFIRYASHQGGAEMDWWYIICDSYDPAKLSANSRSKINRSARRCKAEKINVEWLAENGYECYLAAFGRYKNARPVMKSAFRENLLKTADGPFEYWGVFADGKLAGYCQCVVEKSDVSTNIVKFDPAYLKHYTSYKLITTIAENYLSAGLTISNSSRSVAHETAYQDFLLNLGFRKHYCKLNIHYQPLLHAAVSSLFPFRRILTKLPRNGPVHRLQSLLFQENLRRKCNADSLQSSGR